MLGQGSGFSQPGRRQKRQPRLLGPAAGQNLGKTPGCLPTHSRWASWCQAVPGTVPFIGKRRFSPPSCLFQSSRLFLLVHPSPHAYLHLSCPCPDSCPTAWFQSVLAGRGPRFDPDSGRESPALSHRAGCLSSCWGILEDVHAAPRALDASLEGCRDIGRPPRPWRTTWACSAVQIATEVEGLA